VKEIPIISKERILGYLEYASEKVDAYKLSRWLEVMSDGKFYVNEGKRPNLSISSQLKRRV
jgi:hypothetical protein